MTESLINYRFPFVSKGVLYLIFRLGDSTDAMVSFDYFRLGLGFKLFSAAVIYVIKDDYPLLLFDTIL